MACISCKSTRVSAFPAELNIHHPGIEGIDMPTVWVFPTLIICADCGLVQFTLATEQVRELGLQSADGKGAGAA